MTNIKKSTWFLRSTLIVMGLAVLAFCIFGMTRMSGAILLEYLGLPMIWHVLFVIAGGITGLAFLTALYQSWKLLNYIDKNTAFSESSVNALKNIKYCGIVMGILYMSGMPFVAMVAQADDAPGLIIIGFAFACAPFVVATFAAVLQKLLRNAINVKLENDLTV